MVADDIRNQKAAMLAREVDKEGRRTIGELLKVPALAVSLTDMPPQVS